MTRVLLVTNDFPPTIGGIQSYLRDFVERLDPREVVVFCSTQDPQAARRFDEAAEFSVYRWPRRVMLPTPAVAHEMRRIIAAESIDVVWFGAAAPLGLLAPAARSAGARRVIATTHGHEVGWAMLPGARQALRRVFRGADVVTFISAYTRNRLRKVLGATRVAHVPSGVSTRVFRPASARIRADTRARLGVGNDEPMAIVISRLVPRKGQDQLIRAWPQVRRRVPGARLVVVGGGRYGRTLNILKQRADRPSGATGAGIVMTGRLEQEAMRDALAASDVFAMPARTRFGGLDVEGLGIVYLEAQACGVPVIAGTSGGAPETVGEGCGQIVDGRDIEAIADALAAWLSNRRAASEAGRAGRAYVEREWTMEAMTLRLRHVLGLS
ncbi:GDP-mannose-dependent alpha-(1-6)-phosphatidylinositol monomannoside mannosyltransferase [Corynebacterium atypicum]|uniref:GDP-mannose-dependent alpha-(1-6)-phosphatidylinositol monomannoside mannosyltransferase n=1 Tax=Corynebacterium atypicum TaxID=191610 RepID=A0ABN4DDE6_9CORY|nr:glycosyltransferase family 4 protein [Corynebacterium atypicum]AIG64444.1 GDP-mannose-dependent alpha-(1-6)-phosphatidylinositol monomannoside mannosyltransferase [Corynebacterium atypicum]